MRVAKRIRLAHCGDGDRHYSGPPCVLSTMYCTLPLMTLSTTIRITTPIPPLALLDHLTVLVEGDPATAIRRTEKLRGVRSGEIEIGNALGQGFAAIVEVRYHPDGPLSTERDLDDERGPKPDAAVEVWLDTGYGYHGPNGENCGQLHQTLARKCLAFARGYDENAVVLYNLDTYDEWWDAATSVHDLSDF